MKTANNLILELKTLFPNDLFDVIIGIILGDASIQKNNAKEEKWRLKIYQGKNHGAYAKHLHDLLKDYVHAAVYNNTERNTYTFTTLFSSNFNGFVEIFINQAGKKSLLNTDFFINNPISPVTLAYWFMDDGGSFSYKPRRGFEFNTQGFLESEVEKLSENLNKTYNINSVVRLKKEKQQPSILIRTEDGKKVREIIEPYVIESMRYKLPIKN